MGRLEYVYDTQMIVEGGGVVVDEIRETLAQMPGDCLLVVGDDGLAKIHFHTNEPWKVMEAVAGYGVIYDVVVENMEKQSEEFLG